MTTYLAIRYDDPDNIESEVVVNTFCSRDCAYDLTFGRAREVFRNCNYRDDEQYEFHELCGACGKLILAYIPSEDELRDQIKYALQAIRHEHLEGRITMAEAMDMLTATQFA